MFSPAQPFDVRIADGREIPLASCADDKLKLKLVLDKLKLQRRPSCPLESRRPI